MTHYMHKSWFAFFKEPVLLLTFQIKKIFPVQWCDQESFPIFLDAGLIKLMALLEGKNI